MLELYGMCNTEVYTENVGASVPFKGRVTPRCSSSRGAGLVRNIHGVATSSARVLNGDKKKKHDGREALGTVVPME